MIPHRWPSSGRSVRTQGVDEAVRLFREQRGKDPTFYRERDLNTLGYALMNGGRVPDAVKILKTERCRRPRRLLH